VAQHFHRYDDPGQVATLAPGTIGAEFNVDEDNGFRPAGLMGLSSTSITDPNNYLLDYGSTYGAGTAVHKLTLYKATVELGCSEPEPTNGRGA
jgi:hypothetical protein